MTNSVSHYTEIVTAVIQTGILNYTLRFLLSLWDFFFIYQLNKALLDYNVDQNFKIWWQYVAPKRRNKLNIL
jgi:hypothetical protein